MMRNMNVGVTKPQQKESTKAVGFDLECDKRFKEREANKKPQEEDNYEFHARPWSTKIMEGTVVNIYGYCTFEEAKFAKNKSLANKIDDPNTLKVYDPITFEFIH